MMTNETLAVAVRQGQTELTGQLWGQVERFVYKKANEAMSHVGPGCGVELDDLIQSGYVALADAIQSFDPAKSSFIHWLSFHLRHGFCAYGGYPLTVNSPQEDGFRWEYRNPLNGAASLYAPLKAGNPEEGTLADIVAQTREDGGDDYTDVEDKIYREQLHDALEGALSTLPEAQAKALRGRYYDSLQYSELAEVCGISPAQALKDVRAGMRALRAPALQHELEQFLDAHTDYYAGSGWRSFRSSGSSSVERAALRRESLEYQWSRQHTPREAEER